MPDMPFFPFLYLLEIRRHKEKLVHNKAAKATKICRAAIVLVLVLVLVLDWNMWCSPST
jgi:hypothetical protein